MDLLQLKSLIKAGETKVPDDKKALIIKLKQRCGDYAPIIRCHEISGNNSMAMLISCQAIRVYVYKLYRLVPISLELKKRLRVALLALIKAVENLQRHLNTQAEIDLINWPETKKILSK